MGHLCDRLYGYPFTMISIDTASCLLPEAHRTLNHAREHIGGSPYTTCLSDEEFIDSDASTFRRLRGILTNTAFACLSKKKVSYFREIISLCCSIGIHFRGALDHSFGDGIKS